MCMCMPYTYSVHRTDAAHVPEAVGAEDERVVLGRELQLEHLRNVMQYVMHDVMHCMTM